MASGLSSGINLPQMPPEILLLILREIDCLQTLYHMVEAYDSARLLYSASYKSILICCIEQSGLPLQIQKIISTTLSLHLRRKPAIVDVDIRRADDSEESDDSDDSEDSAIAKERATWKRLIRERNFDSMKYSIEMEEYFTDRLQRTEEPIVVDDLHDPLTSLAEIAGASAKVTEWEQSFLALKCRNPYLRSGFVNKLSGLLNWPSWYTSIDEEPPSFPERCRVRRAFWCLILYCATFYSLDPSTDGEDSLMDSGGASVFCAQFTEFEAEEMECAYLFLHEQHSQLCDPEHCQLCEPEHIESSIPVSRLLHIILLPKSPQLSFLQYSYDEVMLLRRGKSTYTHWTDSAGTHGYTCEKCGVSRIEASNRCHWGE